MGCDLRWADLVGRRAPRDNRCTCAAAPLPRATSNGAGFARTRLHIGKLGFRLVARYGRVDAERNDRDPLSVEPLALELAPGELRRDDDDARVSSSEREPIALMKWFVNASTVV